MMLKSVNEKVEAGRVDGVDRVPNETVDAGVDAEVAEAEGEEEEGRGATQETTTRAKQLGQLATLGQLRPRLPRLGPIDYHVL